MGKEELKGTFFPLFSKGTGRPPSKYPISLVSHLLFCLGKPWRWHWVDSSHSPFYKEGQHGGKLSSMLPGKVIAKQGLT